MLDDKTGRDRDEYEVLMQKRFEKYRKVIFVLKDVLSGFELKDAKSIRGIETYLHLIELSERELVEQERDIREWFEKNVAGKMVFNEGVKARLDEFKHRVGADTDEEIIEELLNMVEGGYEQLKKQEDGPSKP